MIGYIACSVDAWQVGVLANVDFDVAMLIGFTPLAMASWLLGASPT